MVLGDTGFQSSNGTSFSWMISLLEAYFSRVISLYVQGSLMSREVSLCGDPSSVVARLSIAAWSGKLSLH